MQRTLVTPLVLLALLALGCSPSPPEAETSGETSMTEPSPVPDVRGEVVSYEVDGVGLTGYLAYDAGQTSPRPGVLVVHEWWGHNEYARKRAEMLAAMGYTAFALDMYGGGKLAEHPADAMAFMQEATANMDTIVARFQAARDLLMRHEKTDPDRTAAIGYCFGGAVVLHMARLGSDLDAVASFHGDLVPRTEVASGSINARILVANGADDPFVPADTIEAFQAEMDMAGADMKFISYPGALHSFTNPEASAIGENHEMPLAYDQKADEQSWAELEKFLAETFVGV